MTTTTDIAASLAGRKLGKHDLLVVLVPEPLSVEASIEREKAAHRAADLAECGLLLLRTDDSGVAVLRNADFSDLDRRQVHIRVNGKSTGQLTWEIARLRSLLRLHSELFGSLVSQRRAEGDAESADLWQKAKDSVDRELAGGS